jgi:Na+/phosphate symporter
MNESDSWDEIARRIERVGKLHDRALGRHKFRLATNLRNERTRLTELTRMRNVVDSVAPQKGRLRDLISSLVQRVYELERRIEVLERNHH